MKPIRRSWILTALALLLAASTAVAEDERVPFRQEELDQMLAPVALYPDALLSQMLMASTYPLEVVQAARWSRAHPGLKGQDAVRAAEGMDWDPSVKSLTAFPQVLAMMDEKLDWTERLGEAFLAQREDVMDAVQHLRRRAEAAGSLRSGDQVRVARQADAIVIEPQQPQVVYVPYYDPVTVYGAWWWPAYPPVYWAPPPAYYAVPAYRPALFWGSGIVIATGFFFGHFDWPHRHVRVTHIYRTREVHHHARPGHAYWKHDPAHRRGVPFRNAAAYRRYEQDRFADNRRDAGRDGRPRPELRTPRDRTADLRQARLNERLSPVGRPTSRPAQPGARGGAAIAGGPPARAVSLAAARTDARPRPAPDARRQPAPARNVRPALNAPPRTAVPVTRRPADRRLEARGVGSRPGPIARHGPAPRTQPPASRATLTHATRPAATPAARMNDRPRPASRAPRAGGRESGRRS